jgi:hypothetical protein
MFMNGVFDSTYIIRCVLRKTSIMMMQYLSYLVVVCNVTHPRWYLRWYDLPPFHVSASRPSTGFATARFSRTNRHQRLQFYFRASLAQPSYLEAWVYAWRFAIIAWHSALNRHLPAWVQRLPSVCLSIAGSAFEVRVYSG